MANAQLITINAGSSSIKFAAFREEASLANLSYGIIENLHTAPTLKLKDHTGTLIKQQSFSAVTDNTYFYQLLFALLTELNGQIKAVGHRVVHGGADYCQPVTVTPQVVTNLKKLIPFAPLHQPSNIEAIENLATLSPQLLQVACFDTAFHATRPAVAEQFGLPRALSEEGVKRYGFHGLSYEYIVHNVQKVSQQAMGNIIVAHLGNGASLCAIKNGQSIESTMGFTALDGLLMGTRCGSLNPGVILYLLKFKNMSYEQIEECLYKQSGLLGVSGISNNMRILLEDNRGAAKEAINLFVYRLIYHIGALCAVLGGVDMLIFTGGIGENAAPIRAKVCQELAWLGVTLNEEHNNQHDSIISGTDSKVEVRVMPTNEEWVIAQHTYNIQQQLIKRDPTLI